MRRRAADPGDRGNQVAGTWSQATLHDLLDRGQPPSPGFRGTRERHFTVRTGGVGDDVGRIDDCVRRSDDRSEQPHVTTMCGRALTGVEVVDRRPDALPGALERSTDVPHPTGRSGPSIGGHRSGLFVTAITTTLGTAVGTAAGTTLVATVGTEDGTTGVIGRLVDRIDPSSDGLGDGCRRYGTNR